MFDRHQPPTIGSRTGRAGLARRSPGAIRDLLAATATEGATPTTLRTTAQPGAVVLGPSLRNPVLSEWIANPAGAAWLTIDNRLGLSLSVTPSADDSDPGTAGMVAPALRRSTFPIDPAAGVRVAVSDQMAVSGVEFGVAPPGSWPQLHFAKRTCPYVLHNAGGAPTEPLYPPDVLVPSNIVLDLSGPNTGQILWVGAYQRAGLLSVRQLAIGPADTCIVAVSATLLPGTSAAGGFGINSGGLALFGIGDLDDLGNSWVAESADFSSADRPGRSITKNLNGVPGLQVRTLSNTPPLGEYVLAVTAWLGVPAD